MSVRQLVDQQGFRQVFDTFPPEKSKAPETLGISGAWQDILERAKGIEPSKALFQHVSMLCIATALAYFKSYFVSVRIILFDTFSTLL
ncbi:hypothetical protein ACJ5XE_005835 [Pseudomonas aeruginosa]